MIIILLKKEYVTNVEERGKSKMGRGKKKRREFRKYEQCLRESVVDGSISKESYWAKLRVKVINLCLHEEIDLDPHDKMITFNTNAGLSVHEVNFTKVDKKKSLGSLQVAQINDKNKKDKLELERIVGEPYPFKIKNQK